MMKKHIFFLSIPLLLGGAKVGCQNFYALDTIQKIEILFTQSNWDYILDTAKQGSDSYTMSKWVKINGIQFDSAGVKYKGNSSYNPNNQKNPLHIELDHFKNQDYQGYKDIKLSNGFKDPSFVREVLTYKILRHYMNASLSNYATVIINGQVIGLYANTEAVTKTFVTEHFYSKTYPFFFCDNFGCDLNYRGPDSTLYYNSYTMKSDYGWNNLVSLCNILKNNITQIEDVLDVDRALWMLAFNNLLVNLDSYTGQPRHNYYIYQDGTGRFNPIIWDVNEAFGNFSNSGTGSLSIPQMQSMSPLLHLNDSLWPLIKKVLAQPRYLKMYFAHLKTILLENFVDSTYIFDAKYLQNIVDSAYQADPNKFYTYQQFLDNITSNVSNGPFTSPGLFFLMDPRKDYLLGTTYLQYQQPVISGITVSDTFPQPGTVFYITANVANCTQVFCGFRSSVTEKFARQQMFDDGNNGDGAAGDGVYGLAITAVSPEIQYYLYAENNNAGIFAPQRAEHEWYTLPVNFMLLAPGSVVINELLAVNSSVQFNGIGNFSDWVELYNNSADTINLDNIYLSDDYANKAKWKFPEGTRIPPSGYLIVWADSDVFQGEFHSGFKLSGSGEQVILSYGNDNIIDSLTFPAQSTDISWGRYPNGTGPFEFMPPTFNAQNSPFSVTEIKSDRQIATFPNPAGDYLFFVSGSGNNEFDVTVKNIAGETAAQMNHVKDKIFTGDLKQGFYIVTFQNNNELYFCKIIKR